jgi:hypothetical protein
MAVRKLMTLVGAAVLFGTAASSAHAQAIKGRSLDFSVRSETPAISPQGVTKSLKWDARKGRWGLTFNLDQSDRREVQWNDMAAGAYFRVTPSLSVGGAVALGDSSVPNYKGAQQPQEAQPRVRLETAFKF